MREETKKRIGEIIEEAIAAGVTAGVSVLFIENGEEVHFDVHGMADKENGIPLRRDHIHRIFSMTKPITATAAMILMERGVLDFGTPVHEILPGFVCGGIAAVIFTLGTQEPPKEVTDMFDKATAEGYDE